VICFRRVLKLLAGVLGGMSLLGTLATLSWELRWTAPDNQYQVGLRNGRLMLTSPNGAWARAHPVTDIPSGLVAERARFGLRWPPHDTFLASTGAPSWRWVRGWGIPTWYGLLAAASIGVAAWWPELRGMTPRRRRLAAGACVACGYSRAGLPKDESCPECGNPARWNR